MNRTKPKTKPKAEAPHRLTTTPEAIVCDDLADQMNVRRLIGGTTFQVGPSHHLYPKTRALFVAALNYAIKGIKEGKVK